MFTAEKASFRIRLNLIQCRQTFSGIFGDSEKDSKTEINVVNVYEDKNNPQGRKIASDAVLQLYEVEKWYSG